MVVAGQGLAQHLMHLPLSGRCLDVVCTSSVRCPDAVGRCLDTVWEAQVSLDLWNAASTHQFTTHNTSHNTRRVCYFFSQQWGLHASSTSRWATHIETGLQPDRVSGGSRAPPRARARARAVPARLRRGIRTSSPGAAPAAPWGPAARGANAANTGVLGVHSFETTRRRLSSLCAGVARLDLLGQQLVRRVLSVA